VTGQETTRLPVRSAVLKQRTGGLVVRWVTTSEYPLLYVFACLFALQEDSTQKDPGAVSTDFDPTMNNPVVSAISSCSPFFMR
jgi:hypothetical protein